MLKELLPGGEGGKARERAFGRAGAAANNLFASPVASTSRTRTRSSFMSPTYTERRRNRCVECEDESIEEETEHTGGGELTGNRIVDVELMAEFISSVASCPDCGEGLAMTKESRSGLASCFTFTCSNEHKTRFWTSPDADGSSVSSTYTGSWGGGGDGGGGGGGGSSASSASSSSTPCPAGTKAINLMIAAGAAATGNGATTTELLLGGFANIPFPSKWTKGGYRKYEDRIGRCYSEASRELVKATVQEEIRLTTEAHEAGTLGRELYGYFEGKRYVILDLSADGAWTKPTSTKQYNSPSGTQALYGRFTRKPISWNAHSRQCAACDAAKRRIRRDRAAEAAVEDAPAGSAAAAPATAAVAAASSGSDAGESSAASSAVSHRQSQTEWSSAAESSDASGYAGGGGALRDGEDDSDHDDDGDDDEDDDDAAIKSLSAADVEKMYVKPLRQIFSRLGLDTDKKDRTEMRLELKAHLNLGVDEDDEFEGCYPLHAGGCSMNFTVGGKGVLGKDGGKPAPPTSAGNMEREGICKMIAAAPEQGFLVGRITGDDDNKLMSFLREKDNLHPDLFALIEKLADPNHRYVRDVPCPKPATDPHSAHTAAPESRTCRNLHLVW